MSTAPTVPTTLRVAGGILAAEAVVVAGTGIWLAIGAIGESSGGIGMAIGSAILLVLLGLGMLFLSYGVFQVRRWSRGPAAVIELLMIPVAWQLLQGPTKPAGAALVIASIAVLVLIFLPSSTRLFTANS